MFQLKGGEGMNNQNLLERSQRFIDDLGIPVTKFCERVKLSTSGYYAWRNGQLKLSSETMGRIDNYLKQYNF